jgi:hypothetical protein
VRRGSQTPKIRRRGAALDGGPAFEQSTEDAEQSTDEDAMDQPEDAVALAERHVREAEERVALQAAIAERLDEAGDGRAADEARKMLAVLRGSLEIARMHLLVVRTRPYGRLDP